METPSTSAPVEQASRSKQYGRVFGGELKRFVNAVRRPDNAAVERNGTDAPVGKIGQKYEEYTGRDPRQDGRYACMAGVGVAAIVGAGMAVAAASQVVVTGVVLAVGVAGVAACCKVTGHDREYETIVNTSTTVVTRVVSTTRDFAGGLVEGVTHDAPSDANASATAAAPAPAQAPAPGVASVAPSQQGFQPSGSVAGQPLYPVVHAPAPPSSSDLINFSDDLSKRPQ